MMTVHEVSRMAGISIRTLHYYDEIGLLSPTQTTDAGYRLYDDDALERLQLIMLFRELEFPLRDIAAILDASSFDRNRALDQQIRLLEMKKEHLQNLIDLARGIKGVGVKSIMGFKAFDAQKIDEYAAQVKASWGQTKEYREYAQKSKGRNAEAEKTLGVQLMAIFAEIGRIRTGDPAGEQAQALVGKLQEYISANYYQCTDQILLCLGQMYAGGGEMTENIDAAGGEGTARFACEAIQAYVNC